MAVMTKEEYRAKYGRDPVFTTTTPMQTAANEEQKKGGAMKSIFPGQEIGKSLVQAGSNIKNLVTGGKSKFLQGLDEGNRVNVPALIGDYLQAGAATGGAAVPIFKAGGTVAGGIGRGGAVSMTAPTTAAKTGALAKNIGAGAGIGYGAGDVGGGLKEGEGMQSFKPGTGTVLGGAFGGAVGALSRSSKQLGDLPEEVGKALGKRGQAKADSKLLELIMSDTSKKKAISAFKQSGQEGGMTESGFLKKSVRITPTAKDRERMEAVRGLVNPSKSAVENNTRLNNEVHRIAREELEPFLQANPRAFNVQTINAQLKGLKMPDLFRTDKTLENTYNLVRQRMVGAIERNPKTMEGLWKARKEFDKEVMDQFGDAAFNSNSSQAIKRAVRDMRSQVNDYIATEIGGTEFKQYMRRLNNIYAVRDNVAEKAWKQLGSNRFSRWWDKLSPTQKTLVLTGAGSIGAGKILFGGSEASAMTP